MRPLVGRARALLLGVAALIIGVAGPAAGAKPPWTGDVRLLVLAGVVPLAIVTLGLTSARAWPLRLAVAAGAASLIVGDFGKVPALWLGSSLLLAAWVTADRRPLPRLGRCPFDTTAVVVVLALVAVAVGRPIGATWQPIAVLAVAWLAAIVSSSTRVRGSAQLGSGDLVVSGIARGVVAVFAVCSALFWLLAVVFRPVTTLVVVRRGDGSMGGWTESSRVAALPPSPRGRYPGALHLRRWVVPMLVVVLVGGGAVLVTRHGSGPRSGEEATVRGEAGAAVSGQRWYPQYREDLRWLTSDAVAMRPFRPDRVADVATRTVTVQHGIRASWRAPSCDCRRITVWLYGGSGAFGLGQRDQHTIASELARAAARDGYVVDVQNRAVIGELHWRDATRFSWDLTEEPPPDLVVFYGGAEEVDAALALQRKGLGDVLAPYDPVLTDRYDELVGPAVSPDDPIPGGDLVGWPRHRGATPSPGVLAARRYERSRAMSKGAAAAVEVPARWFWEPNRYEGQQSAATSTGERSRRAAYLEASRHLPAGVVDLSGSLADASATRPVFAGTTLIGERGAHLVAEVMWGHLLPDVRRLARGQVVEP